MTAGRRTGACLAAGALFLSAACGRSAEPAPAAEPAASPTRHRGVSWVAMPRVVTAEDFDSLARTGADWIVQTPFGWQDRYDTPELHLVTAGKIFWGETDEGLAVTTRLARERGIRTLLKPHVWLKRPAPGTWRSDIAMSSAEDWRTWWQGYRTFMLHYARLAERLGAGGLCVGTELLATVRHDPDAWRRLIAEVREVFSGELTYAANWHREFEEVPFWDAMDYIGIQAYFPLAGEESPSLEALKAAWQPHVEAIEKVQRRFGKPVLFTEIGYRSAPGATREPWHWTESRPTDGPPDLDLQARAYRAFFEVFWDRPWFAGVYVWKWYPGNYDDLSANADFTPQGKPAERVLAEWFRRGRGGG